MKKFFTTMVVALTMMALPAQAQLGLGWGLNLVSMSSDESTFDSSNRAGWFFGPTAKFTIPLIGIGLDVSALYDQRTSEFEGQSVKEQNVFIPINMVCPRVIFLKCFRSSEICQGSVPFRPIAPSEAIATISDNIRQLPPS